MNSFVEKMEDRKRPFMSVGGSSEQQPTTKPTGTFFSDEVEYEQQTVSRRGRSRVARASTNFPIGGGMRGRQQRPRRVRNVSSQSQGTITDSNKLNFVVCCSSLWYEECRSASIDDFPDRIPTSFRDIDHYSRTFLPLLYEEARESIKSTFSDSADQNCYWNVKVLTVETQGNGWVKIEAILGTFHGKAQPPKLFSNVSVVLTTIRPSKRDPLDNLQQKLKNESKSGLQQQQQKAPAGVISAIVLQQDFESRKLVLRARPVCERHLTIRSSVCHGVLEHLRSFPEEWLLFPTGGLVTQQRECDILHSLDRIPIIDAFLKPTLKLKMNIEDVPRKTMMELGPGIRDFIYSTYDSSQADAILMCTAHFGKDSTEAVDNEGHKNLPVLLIQGPPGTGKTHTVKGILNLWHLVQFERYYKRVIGQFRPEENVSISGRMKKSELATTRILMKPRILVCAPSNAAVDELLERILAQGFRDSAGRVYKPNLVRVAAEDAPFSNEARMVLLDSLVNGYMNMTKLEWQLQKDRLQSKIQILEKEIQELEQKLMTDEKNIDVYGGEFLSNLEKLDKMETEINRLNIVETVVDDVCPNERSAREALELNFLDGAEMVFTTLSSTGKKVLSRVNRGFETVLIDEAAQAAEVASLQPLVYGCRQCVLVGDPQQLPATILSQKGKELNMERSVFARLQEGGAPVKFLNTQYRMHPWIRSFPSAFFYNNALQDGKNITENEYESFYDHDLLKPYVVFDVPTGLHERQGGGSLQNQVEADLAAALFRELRDFLIRKQREAELDGLPGPKPVRVGVLTPYRSQTRCLTNTFVKMLGPVVASEVKIMTVDSCQGKQLDVVIFSCVRGSPKASSVGFVADIRRMNVAITRAKKALWILGNFRTLVAHPAWAALAEDAKNRECFVIESTAQSLFPHHEPYEAPQEDSSQFSKEVEEQNETTSVDLVDPRIGRIKTTDGQKQINKEDQPVKNENPVSAEPDSSKDNQVQTPPVIDLQLEDDPTTSHSTTLTSTMPAQEEENSQRQLPVMIIRATGRSEILGPSTTPGEATLTVDTSSGKISTPVSILYHGQEGFDASLLLDNTVPKPITKKSRR